jgi:hypothetical protein
MIPASHPLEAINTGRIWLASLRIMLALKENGVGCALTTQVTRIDQLE